MTTRSRMATTAEVTQVVTVLILGILTRCGYGWMIQPQQAPHHHLHNHLHHLQQKSQIQQSQRSNRLSSFLALSASSRSSSSSSLSSSSNDFVDADFERVTKQSSSSQDSRRRRQPQQQPDNNNNNNKKKKNDGNNDKEDDNITADDFTTPYSFNSNNQKVKNLIDLSLETSDLNWKNTRIPFYSPTSDTCIDGKLAFMVDIPQGNGKVVSYGIAVPFDDAVAIVEEQPNKNKVNYIHPDFYENDDDSTDSSRSKFDPDESLELMEIMAVQVKEHLGEDLTLCKTPKVLTITGGLDKITNNWQTELMDKPATVKELLETLQSSSSTVTEKVMNQQQQQEGGSSSTRKKKKKNKKETIFTPEEEQDEDIADFMNFMKEELGEEEFDKTMSKELSVDDLDADMLELFNVPGLGLQDDEDDDGMQELIQSMLVDLEEVEAKEEAARTKNNDDDDDESSTTLEKESKFITDPDFMKGAALKLISYNFPKGRKSYSLVKLLQPFVLIGRYVDYNVNDVDDEIDYEADDIDPSEDKRGDIQFELLTPAEEKIIIPKLEELCQKDLEEAGLSLLQP